MKSGSVVLDCRYSRFALASGNCPTCAASEQKISVGAGFLFGAE